LQMANIRRGVALGASGEEASADRANGTIIESKNGSAIATPTPRRKWRREMGCRVETWGAWDLDFDGMRISGSRVYFIWNKSLCTSSRTRLRMP
jgi:hypothetical protein